jgi:hypothetical protein
MTRTAPTVTRNGPLRTVALIAMMAVTGLATAAHADPNTYKISESGSFFSGIQQQGFSGLVTSDLAITAGKGSGLGQTSTQARFVWGAISATPGTDPDSTTSGLLTWA